MEAIEKWYDERFRKIDKIQKLCEKSVQEVKDIYGTVNNIENKIRICNEIKKIVKDTNVKQKMSYAQIAANNIVMPDISENVPLIVKPKEKQSVEKTKTKLNENTLVIKSKNVEEREKIKEALETQISKDYEIKVPKQIGIQIIITDMNFKMQENAIIEKLKKQNEILKDSKIEMIKIYESK